MTWLQAAHTSAANTRAIEPELRDAVLSARLTITDYARLKITDSSSSDDDVSAGCAVAAEAAEAAIEATPSDALTTCFIVVIESMSRRPQFAARIVE